MSESNHKTFDIQYLKGIGPKRADVLAAAGIKSIKDLIGYFPRRYIDRSTILPLNKLIEGQEVTVIGKVEASGIKRGRRPQFYITVTDGKGLLEAVWFNAVSYYKNVFKIGDWVSLSGKVIYYQGYQLNHPDYDKLGEDDFENMTNTGRIIPFYPLTDSLRKAGISSSTFRKIFIQLFEKFSSGFKEHLPDKILKNQKFTEINHALKEMHLPSSQALFEQSTKRFIYEEFFYLQLLFALQKKHMAEKPLGISFSGSSPILKKLFDNLPFEMTSAQKKVVKEIRTDMKSSSPMNRLLQGDVGSGKTLVAMMAALIAIDNGYQVALMAPTEILAEQHFSNIKNFLKPFGVEVILLKGGRSPKEKSLILHRIQQNVNALIIGTHALIQQKVDFPNLGLVIIDEQHRFGVMQRGSLISKGTEPDVLVMTATPIPRTLAMTAYGSLDVSTINEMPANRLPIRTVWRFDSQSGKIYEFIRKQVNAGEQAYIVYPLVEESEKLDLKAAVEAFKFLENGPLQGISIGLLHGRMKAEEKDAIMQNFANGEIKILVATTVIEVGVDVSNSTIMLIEHAERFGLAQLHQLRGRVGRGKKQSYCILKTPNNVGEIARERIRTMTETTDGFVISEKDLEIRGWGDFFGKKQSGMPIFKLANPIRDREILEEARKDAFILIDEDPHLRSPENGGVRKKVSREYSERLALFKIS
ncbi:MAG: ATP-dependent DNA helicase RecG [Calditrichaeota bacterium]|nr:MAG: ATP-dependent DNA helicase RecG [Calditrichota bacterium]MBL1207582.1 ATP-dependent DNA helicase RecG [Calditrichota bacterium]NOG47414.1 ATP-dependent DNA helicase RecG [Calditrichota bacterium]